MNITKKLINIMWIIALLASLTGCINFKPDVQPLNVQTPPNSNTPINSSFSFSYDPTKTLCNQDVLESANCNGNDKYSFLEVKKDGATIGALLMIDGVLYKIWKDIDGQYLISCGTDESGSGKPISQDDFDNLQGVSKNIKEKSEDVEKKWDEIRAIAAGLGVAGVLACGIGALGAGIPTAGTVAIEGCLAGIAALGWLGVAGAAGAAGAIVTISAQLSDTYNDLWKYEDQYKAFRDKYLLSCSKKGSGSW